MKAKVYHILVVLLLLIDVNNIMPQFRCMRNIHEDYIRLSFSSTTAFLVSAVATPTGQPTGQPSRQPTRQPTSQPSRQPTRQPSSQPSAQPTRVPVTSFPSSVPSATPSSFPSFQPSSQPTAVPSGQPSRQPFSRPTGQPSRQPSRQPTRQPTNRPSGQPSRQPTSQPSRQPTSQPSRQPTRQPTGQPSRQPSSQPSRQPTRSPSGQPSSRPSGQPSRQPSRQPSAQPNGHPTAQPTSQPSRQPSSQPFSSPTAVPTTVPTSFPTSTPQLSMVYVWVAASFAVPMVLAVMFACVAEYRELRIVAKATVAGDEEAHKKMEMDIIQTRIRDLGSGRMSVVAAADMEGGLLAKTGAGAATDSPSAIRKSNNRETILNCYKEIIQSLFTGIFAVKQNFIAKIGGELENNHIYCSVFLSSKIGKGRILLVSRLATGMNLAIMFIYVFYDIYLQTNDHMCMDQVSRTDCLGHWTKFDLNRICIWMESDSPHISSFCTFNYSAKQYTYEAMFFIVISASLQMAPLMSMIDYTFEYIISAPAFADNLFGISSLSTARSSEEKKALVNARLKSLRTGITSHRKLLESNGYIDQLNEFDINWGVFLTDDGKEELLYFDKIVSDVNLCVTQFIHEENVLQAASEEVRGVQMLFYFALDVMGLNSPAARIFRRKADPRFQALAPMTLAAKFFASFVMLALNVMAIVISIVVAEGHTDEWMNAVLYSIACYLAIDFFLVEGGKFLIVHVGVPMFVSECAAVAHARLMQALEGVCTDSYMSKSDFSVSDYVYSSVSLARLYPQLLESAMVLSLRNPLPALNALYWHGKYYKSLFALKAEDMLEGKFFKKSKRWTTWQSIWRSCVCLCISLSSHTPIIVQRFLLHVILALTVGLFIFAFISVIATSSVAIYVVIFIALMIFSVVTLYSSQSSSNKVTIDPTDGEEQPLEPEEEDEEFIYRDVKPAKKVGASVDGAHSVASASPSLKDSPSVASLHSASGASPSSRFEDGYSTSEHSLAGQFSVRVPQPALHRVSSRHSEASTPSHTPRGEGRALAWTEYPSPALSPSPSRSSTSFKPRQPHRPSPLELELDRLEAMNSGGSGAGAWKEDEVRRVRSVSGDELGGAYSGVYGNVGKELKPSQIAALQNQSRSTRESAFASSPMVRSQPLIAPVPVSVPAVTQSRASIAMKLPANSTTAAAATATAIPGGTASVPSSEAGPGPGPGPGLGLSLFSAPPTSVSDIEKMREALRKMELELLGKEAGTGTATGTGSASASTTLQPQASIRAGDITADSSVAATAATSSKSGAMAAKGGGAGGIRPSDFSTPISKAQQQQQWKGSLGVAAPSFTSMNDSDEDEEGDRGGGGGRVSGVPTASVQGSRLQEADHLGFLISPIGIPSSVKKGGYGGGYSDLDSSMSTHSEIPMKMEDLGSPDGDSDGDEDSPPRAMKPTAAAGAGAGVSQSQSLQKGQSQRASPSASLSITVNDSPAVRVAGGSWSSSEVSTLTYSPAQAQPLSTGTGVTTAASAASATDGGANRWNSLAPQVTSSPRSQQQVGAGAGAGTGSAKVTESGSLMELYEKLLATNQQSQALSQARASGRLGAGSRVEAVGGGSSGGGRTGGGGGGGLEFQKDSNPSSRPGSLPGSASDRSYRQQSILSDYEHIQKMVSESLQTVNSRQSQSPRAAYASTRPGQVVEREDDEDASEREFLARLRANRSNVGSDYRTGGVAPKRY